MTQMELARIARGHGARVAGSHICQYEQGKRSPQAATLRALASSLNVPPTALLVGVALADLARLRVLAGFNQRLLARQLGVAQARWSRIERGRALLEESKHSLAAVLLQVTVEQLHRALDAARTRQRPAAGSDRA